MYVRECAKRGKWLGRCDARALEHAARKGTKMSNRKRGQV